MQHEKNGELWQWRRSFNMNTIERPESERSQTLCRTKKLHKTMNTHQWSATVFQRLLTLILSSLGRNLVHNNLSPQYCFWENQTNLIERRFCFGFWFLPFWDKYCLKRKVRTEDQRFFLDPNQRFVNLRSRFGFYLKKKRRKTVV